MSNKPPLGIQPEFLWQERRLIELASAIERYINGYWPMPIEWITEYNKLAEIVKERNA